MPHEIETLVMPLRNNWTDYFIHYCTRVVVCDPTYLPGLHYSASMWTQGYKLGLKQLLGLLIRRTP